MHIFHVFVSGDWDLISSGRDVVVRVVFSCLYDFIVFRTHFESFQLTMSDSEIDTDVLSEVGSRHSSVSVSGNSDADEFVFEGDFLPYQYEPLASSSNEDILLDSEVEDDDEDGIPRDVLEQRYENTITVDSW